MLVKDICEMFGEYRTPTGFSQKKEVINKAVDHVFSFDYPIYDEAYRSVLNKKILNHFYMSDIGQESIGLWQHYLETTLNEIMPYYNQLFESELLKFNPLLDIDLEKTYNRGIDGTKTGNTTLDSITDYIRNLQAKANGTSDSSSDSSVVSTTTADSTNNTDKDDWNLFLDTPQGGLGNFYGVKNTDGTTGKYLTEARHQYGEQTDVASTTGENDTVSSLTNNETTSNTVDETGTTKNTVSNESNSTENTNQNEQYTESVTGKQGGASYSKMLLEFRDTILNIDRMILKDLEPLFYGLW